MVQSAEESTECHGDIGDGPVSLRNGQTELLGLSDSGISCCNDLIYDRIYKVQGSNMSVYPSKNEGQDLVNVNADSTWQPLATVMEAAKILGHKSTGLVVTVTATHATPGATTAHTVSRSEHHDIIRQMASNRVDVIFGGGVDYMDDDVKSILEDNGITYIEKDVPAFRAVEKAPVWALFARRGYGFRPGQGYSCGAVSL